MKVKILNKYVENMTIIFIGTMLSVSAFASTQLVCKINQNQSLPKTIIVSLDDKDKALISLEGRDPGYGSYTVSASGAGHRQYLIEGQIPPGLGQEPSKISLGIVSNSYGTQGRGVLIAKSREYFSMNCSMSEGKKVFDSTTGNQQENCCYLNCATGNYFCQPVPVGQCIFRACH